MDQAAQPSLSSSGSMDALPESLDLSGKTLGDFRLLRRLGQGGMGQVYLAEQISLKRKVAIKIMRPDVAVNATSYQRFRAEAEAIARITHANIVAVYALAEEAGLHYMALEYVEGRNLREHLIKKGPPDVPLALSIMRQVAAALQRASELGIVHRDIKPENILLTRRGEVKVADFGLSRCFAEDRPAVHLTQPGLTMGTPMYMSPEQIQGHPVDPRTDIYSFGVTSYHMLAGQPPFLGQTALELAIQHVKTQPPRLNEVRPDLPAELCAVVHKMMAKELDKRYQSCSELLKDLARLRESFGGQKTDLAVTAANLTASQPTSSTNILLPVLPSRWLLCVAATSIVVALVGGGALAWMRNKSRALTEQPQQPIELPPALTEEQKQEKFMSEAVVQYADPGKDPMRLEFGLKHALELGLFYLKHHRLEDAERFFAGLRDNPYRVDAYRTLGLIGHAIVLGRQNRAAESNRVFLDLLSDKGRSAKPADRFTFLLNQPRLRQEIGRALDYNKINASADRPFPQQLEALRDPPRPPSSVQGVRKAGQEKKPAKNP